MNLQQDDDNLKSLAKPGNHSRDNANLYLYVSASFVAPNKPSKPTDAPWELGCTQVKNTLSTTVQVHFAYFT